MKEFRRWKGESLKFNRPAVGGILLMLFRWLVWFLGGMVLVLLIYIYSI